jgi:hypothetical protein
MIHESAFTGSANGLANQLVSFIDVSLPHGPQDNEIISTAYKFKCIWDTGATTSVITNKVVSQLKLEPVGKTLIQGVTGSDTRNRYLVNFKLPNGFNISYVSVTECDSLTGDFDVLIGMDIINLGDFAVTNLNGKTIFSFRMPSMEEIDFVKAIQLNQSKKKTDGKHFYGEKVGPNEACPCGSGKKFKKCCRK